MPPKSKTAKTPAKIRPAAAITTVSVPTAEPDGMDVAPPIEFEYCGERYVAHMPKDFTYMEIAAAWAPGAGHMAKARAISLFVRSCLGMADRERLEERLTAPAADDPCTGMELLTCIDKLQETWKPYMECMFERANIRAAAAR